MISTVASFRDPSGSCFLLNQRVLRYLNAEGSRTANAFLGSRTAREFLAKKRLVQTRQLPPTEAVALQASGELAEGLEFPPCELYEHERIPFVSFPYEWPEEMLWEAGCLTLELARTSLAEGYGLKDATPYNVLFRGPEPVFVDLGSFELRRAGDPAWNANGQFIRTFLLPLLVHRRWGVELVDIFLSHRDGLEPEQVYRFCSGLERLSPKLLSLVSLPTWLSGRANNRGEQLYQPQTLRDPERARFVVESLIKRLQSSLNALRPTEQPASTWSDYMSSHSYSQDAFAAKEKFVDGVLAEFVPRRVLDAGANTGHFSFRAARAGAEVVAIDLDAACVGRIWRQAQRDKLNVLPLVVNLARPTPSLGWRNRETPGFLDRACGSFDAVLMLAVIHHLLVTERIPLEEIFRLAAELTTSVLVVEYVDPKDDMFRRITRGREHLHADLNEALFEQTCSKHFEIIRSLPLPGGTRRMYALKNRFPGEHYS